MTFFFFLSVRKTTYKSVPQILLNHKPLFRNWEVLEQSPSRKHMTRAETQHRSAAFANMIQTRTFLLSFLFFVFSFAVVFAQTTSPVTSKFQPLCCLFTSFLTVYTVKQQWLRQYILNYSAWIAFWGSALRFVRRAWRPKWCLGRQLASFWNEDNAFTVRLSSQHTSRINRPAYFLGNCNVLIISYV